MDFGHMNQLKASCRDLASSLSGYDNSRNVERAESPRGTLIYAAYLVHASASADIEESGSLPVRPA